MSFEAVMMKRLSGCHTEACKEILAGVKSGRSISDAVTDTIEALPASKTRGLRRWLEEWETYREWLDWKAKGWQVKPIGKGIYRLITPPNPPGSAFMRDKPSAAVIAVAAGVRAVRDPMGAWERFDERGHERWDRVYVVVS